MTMAQWTKYFGSPEKDRILNVISLEFSHTGMDRLVEPPELVRISNLYSEMPNWYIILFLFFSGSSSMVDNRISNC